MDGGQEQKTVDGLSGFLAAVDAGRRRLPKQTGAAVSRLGELLGGLIEPRRAAQDEAVLIDQQWAELVPPHVAGHCCVRGVERGQLHVTVDSPVYAYELRLCSHDLLKQIRRRWPGLGLRKIKVTLA